MKVFQITIQANISLTVIGVTLHEQFSTVISRCLASSKNIIKHCLIKTLAKCREVEQHRTWLVLEW